MNTDTGALRQLVCEALEDAKAVDVRALDVRGMTDITDFMIVAGGTSERHLRALAERVRRHLRQHDTRPLGLEGMESAGWVLLDYGDVVVHLMDTPTRRFYDIERLWDEGLRNPAQTT